MWVEASISVALSVASHCLRGVQLRRLSHNIWCAAVLLSCEVGSREDQRIYSCWELCLGSAGCVTCIVLFFLLAVLFNAWWQVSYLISSSSSTCSRDSW